MKTIYLKNPEEAQQIFIDNGWIDSVQYFIKVLDSENEQVLLNSRIILKQHIGVSLKIRFSTEYTIILDDFGNQISLELKTIQYLGVLLIINDIPYLLKIQKNASQTEIDRIDKLYPDLRMIDATHCENISDLNSISNLNLLTSLDLWNCEKLSDFSPISKLINLTYLNLGCSDSLTDLSPVSSLFKLTHLNLGNNCNVIDIQPLSGLPNLKNLDLGGCINLGNIDPVSTIKKLTNLNLDGCYMLSDLSPISGLHNLSTLSLFNCAGLKDLSPILTLKNLLKLNLQGGITELSAISELKNLSDLNLDDCLELKDISPVSQLTSLTKLSLCNCWGITDLQSISELNNLTFLNISGCINIRDLTPIYALRNLTALGLSGYENKINLHSILSQKNLAILNLSFCENLKDISSLSRMEYLFELNLTYCTNLTQITSISSLPNLRILNLESCSNIRDFNSLAALPNLKKLEWIDPVACSQVLMQSATNRQDSEFILSNIGKWISEVELSKDPVFYVSKLLTAISLLRNNNGSLYKDVCASMRTRGLQSEALNDLDTFTWGTWCNLVLELELSDAINCLKAAVTELDIQRETEVVLGPVIIASSELIEKHPSEKLTMMAWVNEQLQHLQDYPAEERQIAPSAAVFFASLNMKEEVLFWLEKATDQKAPLWRDKVLAALINYYAQKEEFTECRRLLDMIQIEEQRDHGISSIAVAMGEKYPVEAAFLLDDIKDLSISTAAANRLLQQSSVLDTPQGIYQLLLHLQSNPEELALTIETLIEKDQEGKVAHAVKQLFLQKQPTGPSAAVLLELCQHPSITDFVKPRALEKYKTNLQDRFNEECVTSVPLLLAEMQQEEMIDEEEAVELLKLMQQS